MRNFRQACLIGGLLCLFGCARSGSEDGIGKSVDVPVMLNDLPAGDLLGQHEIAAFLAVLQRLPGQQAPEFAESILPRLTSVERLDTAVIRLRQAIRDAVTPERQVMEWQESPELQRAFASMQVNPLAFANLMLQISCAWSAWSVEQETSLSTAREQLDGRVVQLWEQLHSAAVPVGSIEQLQLLETLEELITLTEFLRLLEQVPPENVTAVAAARDQLQAVLPDSALADEFTKYLRSQSTILRAGYSYR